MKNILKYLGTYTLFFQTNSDGSKSKNKDDNYLKGRYNSEIFRHSDDIISIYLPSGSSSVNSLMPKFEEENIKVWKHISDEVCEEAILQFKEEDIHKVHKIMKFMIVGKNQQLKEYKQKLKEEKLKAKLKSM